MGKVFASARAANVTALVALFVALGGTSYAALTITGKNVKNSSLTGADIKNNSIASADVKNGSLLSGDFKAGQLPAGAKGATGATGAAGAKGDKGDPGVPGPATGAAGGALAGNYPDPTLSPTGRGPAFAGVRLVADGTVSSWFNRRGAVPTVAHVAASGIYNVTFPGSSLNINLNVIPVATLVGVAGEVSVDSIGGAVQVQTRNSAGAPTDAAFVLTAFDASATG